MHTAHIRHCTCRICTLTVLAPSHHTVTHDDCTTMLPSHTMLPYAVRHHYTLQYCWLWLLSCGNITTLYSCISQVQKLISCNNSPAIFPFLIYTVYLYFYIAICYSFFLLTFSNSFYSINWGFYRIQMSSHCTCTVIIKIFCILRGQWVGWGGG